ncbi:MAG: RidA family protein [Dehalococcoidia bacterium]|nr:RidA family protein [Dehalococcoidia bacterium]MDW8120414.1 RidA family protein [Chloroflexota bacterium]
MPKQIINPPTVHTPIGRGYSHAVKVGNTVYIAGQVALDAQGTLVGKGDIRAQTDQVFRNLQAVLQACGGSLRDLVKINVYLVRAEDIPAFREVRSRYLAQEPPASTLAVICQLASPDFLVEVEGIAVVGA